MSSKASTQDLDWHMLDKTKFFFLGTALFSGVSGALHPIVVLKTRQQVSRIQIPCTKTALNLLRHEGIKAFYRGFGTSLIGTIPARALYMTALEVTKTKVAHAAHQLGFSDSTAATAASAAAGLSSAIAAQLVWTPIDVVSQRLMVQERNFRRYDSGMDAFRKILCTDGARGLYRGLGVSIMTYAPSNAAWWGSYSAANKLLRGVFNERGGKVGDMGVVGVSAAAASGVSALVTMPLDTVKTRMQVLGEGKNVLQAVGRLVREGGGIGACYRGLGARWASMSMSAVTMITTYELLKRLSAKSQHRL